MRALMLHMDVSRGISVGHEWRGAHGRGGAFSEACFAPPSGCAWTDTLGLRAAGQHSAMRRSGLTASFLLHLRDRHVGIDSRTMDRRCLGRIRPMASAPLIRRIVSSNAFRVGRLSLLVTLVELAPVKDPVGQDSGEADQTDGEPKMIGEQLGYGHK